MGNKLLITTGYMGSGSSACTDLLSEYKDLQCNNGSFEYVFLHCPNGVFDLEDKLLIGNNAIRSDEAIHSFLLTMKDLHTKKLWWPGNYASNLSPHFYTLACEFVKSLTIIESDSYWYYQQNLSKLKSVLNLLLRVASKVHISPKNAILLNYHPMLLAIPTHEEFYKNAKLFIYACLNEMGLHDHSLLIDQLMLPHNLWRMGNYFNDDTYAIAVDRDPRDVFILNKYYWHPANQAVPFPLDVTSFCRYYRAMRESVRPYAKDRVIDVHFEDLVYRYSDTVSMLEARIGYKPEDHILRFDKFDPRVSINNTQLFKNDMYRNETKYIEENLKEYLYSFPYDKPDHDGLIF